MQEIFKESVSERLISFTKLANSTYFTRVVQISGFSPSGIVAERDVEELPTGGGEVDFID
jgi:hypothetical protein